MATTNLIISCGCGLRVKAPNASKALEAAELHSEQTGHTMSIVGSVVSSTPKLSKPHSEVKPRAATQLKSTAPRNTTDSVDAYVEGEMNSFKSMKSRLLNIK